MKNIKHIGSYGLIVCNEQILLISKVGGPYNGKLDLPGGTIEFGEKPDETLIRELKEEVGIKIIEYELFDANSTVIKWRHNDEDEIIHHLGVFYRVINYTGMIKESIEIDKINDDSKGASFYPIKNLKKGMLSDITFMEIEKLGYNIN